MPVCIHLKIAFIHSKGCRTIFLLDSGAYEQIVFYNPSNINKFGLTVMNDPFVTVLQVVRPNHLQKALSGQPAICHWKAKCVVLKTAEIKKKT